MVLRAVSAATATVSVYGAVPPVTFRLTLSHVEGWPDGFRLQKLIQPAVIGCIAPLKTYLAYEKDSGELTPTG